LLGQTKHKIDLGQIRIDAPLASPHTALSDVRVPLKLPYWRPLLLNISSRP